MRIYKLQNYEKTKVIKIINEDNPRHEVMISDLASYGQPNKGVGINWSAMGTTPVEEAEQYIKLMKAAIAEAKRQNKKLLNK